MKTSKELLALTDLAGWRVADGYWAQLAHGLCGTFPALFRESGEGDGEMFVCLDKEVLQGALGFLTPRALRISKNLVLANETLGLAFDLTALCNQRDMGRESEPLRLFTANDLRAKGDSKFFQWAPGLIGNDMSAAEFKQTLLLALKAA